MVFSGRLQDTFTPVIAEKLDEFGLQINQHVMLGDRRRSRRYTRYARRGVMDMIVCTGGMSVDPMIEHLKRSATAAQNCYLRCTRASRRYVHAGLYQRRQGSDGASGCVMYANHCLPTSLPSIMSDVQVSPEKLVKYGEGSFVSTAANVIFRMRVWKVRKACNG